MKLSSFIILYLLTFVSKICSAQEEAGIIKRKHILRFVDASFSWMEGGPTILQNLTLNIPNGELTVIIGEIKH